MRRADKTSDGPIGLGTQYRGEVVSGRQVIAMVIELTGYDRPRMLASTTPMSSIDVRDALTFDSVSQGTRMRWTGEVKPKGWPRLMAPIVGWIGRRQELRIWTSVNLLEGPDAPAAH